MFIYYGNGILDTFKRDKSKGFSPNDRKLINKVKDIKIYRLTIFRYPVQSAIQNVMKLYTQGRLTKNMRELNYDNLFHLGLIVNQNYILDKQATPKFQKINDLLKSKKPQTMNIHVKKNISIGELIENTKNFMGLSKFSNYNAVKNNCQVFVKSILDANQLNNPLANKFIFQDIKQILGNEYSLNFLGKTATDLGAILDRVIYGNGLL